jgi:hypothetical protein
MNSQLLWQIRDIRGSVSSTCTVSLQADYRLIVGLGETRGVAISEERRTDGCIDPRSTPSLIRATLVRRSRNGRPLRRGLAHFIALSYKHIAPRCRRKEAPHECT